MLRGSSLLMVGLLLVACGTEYPTQPLDSAPSFAISDALHPDGGPGNSHFFWLPPMVPNPGPAATGAFASLRSPIVVICVLEASGSTCDAEADTVASFTMLEGDGSETVRAGGDHYIVNWHTGDSDLDISKRYRIMVLDQPWNESDPVRLGYADVQPATTGAGFKDVNTDEYIPLLDGRTLPIKFRVDLNDPAIVFSSTRDGFIDLYLVHPDGSGLTQLTNDPAADLSPQWSPDGTKIAWASDNAIWVMDLVTGARKPLTPDDVVFANPSWAPDGRSVVYEKHRCGGPACSDPAFGLPDIWWAWVFEPGAGPLTDTPHHMDEDPEWSPDGTAIVFERKCEPYGGETCPAGDDDELWIMRVDDGSLPPVGPLPMATRLVSMGGEDIWAGNPAWSPDGGWIAFSAGLQEDDDVDNAWGIWVANADGSGVSLVFAGCGAGGTCYDLTDPSWSPDGTQILFTRRPTGTPFDFEVWMMDADGSNVHSLITSGGVDALARWKRLP